MTRHLPHSKLLDPSQFLEPAGLSTTDKSSRRCEPTMRASNKVVGYHGAPRMVNVHPNAYSDLRLSIVPWTLPKKSSCSMKSTWSEVMRATPGERLARA